MKRTSIVAPLVLVLVSTVGCVSKKRLEEAQGELAKCQEEVAQKDAAVAAWEERFDRESDRWKEMETSVTDALPKALSELHAERNRILELVPEQVESEVSAYLEDYFSTVMRGFELLKEDNQDVKIRLQATYDALAAVGADTKSIGRSIDQTVASERQKRQEVSRRLADVVAQVVDFDQTRVNCKGCDERLRLNRKERETILAFHAELVSHLAELQGLTGQTPSEPPPAKPPATPPPTTDEAATGE